MKTILTFEVVDHQDPDEIETRLRAWDYRIVISEYTEELRRLIDDVTTDEKLIPGLEAAKDLMWEHLKDRDIAGVFA